MKPNFALDLSHEGINLLHRSKGGWTLVGSVALDDPNMGTRLEELRRSAAMLESGGFTTKLIIPDSQILYTTVDAPGPDDISREVQIRAGLDGVTPYPVGDLVFDWRAQGDQARVAVLARETMDEAEGFAVQHKFNPVSFVARPGRGEFSGEPFFGKTRASARILPPGERIEPDASPVPKNPQAKELPAEARVDYVDEAVEEFEPPQAPEPEITASPEPEPFAADDDGYDPFAELDKLAAELSGEVDPSKPLAAKPAPKPRRKRRDDAPRVAAPPLAPFPPTPDEVSDGPAATPRPFMPKPDKPASARKSPVPKAPEPTRSPVPPAPDPDPETPFFDDMADVAPEPTATDPSQDSDTQAVSFSSTRARTATPAAGEQPQQPVQRDDAPGDTTRSDAPARTSPVPPALDPAPAPTRAAPLVEPAPAFPHDPVRAGMADALSKPLPRASDTEASEPKRSGLLTRASGGVRSGLAARAEKRAARQAEVAEAALARKAPDKSAPATEETEAPKKGRLGSRGAADKGRDKEAEALTVFGARRGQSTPERPRYLGIILTLVLLLLMAAAAVWSSFLVDDGETSLFNPGPDTAAESPAVAENTPEPDAAETPEPAPPATAEVLSPEAAEARYAATGIWQRAPEVPAEPETTRLSALDLSDLGPVVSSRNPTPLPDGSTGGTGDAALADPVPPPPPGTTFDLGADGLVVPTPEGALSPTGILVYSGQPAVAPPAPPEGLLPQPEAAPQTAEPAAGAAPDSAEPATETAQDTTTGDAADAAVEAAIAAAETATEPFALPGVPSVRPAARPANVPPIPAPSTAPTETTTDEPAPDATATDDNAALTPPAARPEAVPAVTDTAAIDAAVDDAIAAALVNPTELAVPASIKPSHRPSNFDTIVTAARSGASDGSQVIAASAVVTPSIPTSASVASRATTENALNLRKINLIGIYGSSSSRRALVRLDNGRYVKVEVGDRLDGGKVTSISSSRLTYQKGSRAYTLEVLPLG